MTMRTGLWAIGLILFGLGLLAVAAWQYFGPDDGPGLTVDEAERRVSGCSAGKTTVVTFQFHNRARHPVQVLSLVPC